MPGEPNGGPIVVDPENQDSIEPLQEVMEHHPRGVYPFVGAGFSRDFGYPSWETLMKDGAKRVGRESEIATLVASQQYEEAMSVIYDHMPGVTFEDFLVRVFRWRDPEKDTSLSAARFLPALPDAPIVTTNIDSVLEHVFAEAHTPLDVIVGARKGLIREAVQLQKRRLIKIHGEYRDESARILTREDYTRHYGEGVKDNPFYYVLRNLLTGNSYLFLGYGLEPRTRQILQSIGQSYGLRRHWIVTSRSGSAEKDRAFTKEAAIGNVAVIWHDRGEYRHLAPFLQWLCYQASPKGSDLREFYRCVRARDWRGAWCAGNRVSPKDPALQWNLTIVRELLARQYLITGQLDEARSLLSIDSVNECKLPSHATQSTLSRALEFVLSDSRGNLPAEISRFGIESSLELLRSAICSSSMPSVLPSRPIPMLSGSVSPDRVCAAADALHGNLQPFAQLVAANKAGDTTTFDRLRRRMEGERPDPRVGKNKIVNRMRVAVNSALCIWDDIRLDNAKREFVAAEVARCVPERRDWMGMS